jgi:exosortase A-associated hydrolase 2
MRWEDIRRRVAEESLYFAGPRSRLYATTYAPAEAPRPGRAVVFCHPFGDERRLSARVMVRMARVLAAAGVAVLRFDMGGAGDSEGSFGDQTLAGWVDDIDSALAYLRDKLATDDVGLLGLRLGGALAARVAARDRRVPRLVLWQPILGRADGIVRDLKRKRIREMLTRGETIGAEGDLGQGSVDLDGWEVSSEMWDEMSRLDTGAELAEYAGELLVVQISFRAVPEPAIESMARARGTGRRVIEVVKAQPFWNPLDIHDSPEVVRRTLGFLAPGRRAALGIPA